MYFWLIVILSLAEVVLLCMLLHFFARLRRSESLLTRLRDGQESLMDKLRANAELERELMGSFIARQAELTALNDKLAEREAELKALLEQAEAVSRSPQFLRELITQGSKKGRTPQQLAKATGLSVDEVNLILANSQ